MILFLSSDCKKTHTSLTSLLCKYLSVILVQLVMQLAIYRCMNSLGRETVRVRRFTTSMEWRDMSMETREDKYEEEEGVESRWSMEEWATRGLFSTRSLKFVGLRGEVDTWEGETFNAVRMACDGRERSKSSKGG